ncbi:unnamed protein product [Euphydryas editha]|uniref:Reverse transcriptase domain-containing protein n=1 Tax=Euphydryas editha TaxID=104508 RepID=A0AAU9V7A5_EUPED|nr:unnamed protein product [Euphydryas editha]
MKHVDNNRQVDAVYADFSKAFDRVPHQLILKKITAYGVRGSVLSCFESYISKGPISKIKLLTPLTSTTRYMNSGVPPGSHLGTILFKIFVNDLPHLNKHSAFSLLADDLQLWKVINTSEDVSLLQSELNAFMDWCRINCMEINIKKCNHIKFSRKLFPNPLVYSINSMRLEKIEIVKDLGVLMDSKMTFVPHIDGVRIMLVTSCCG